MSRPYRGRGRSRGNDRFGYGRERRHPYEQEYPPRDRDFPDRGNFRRDDVRDFRRDRPREGASNGPREPPRQPWESRDRPPPRDPRDRDPRDRDPRDRDSRDSPREFRDRDRPPSGPRDRHDSHSHHGSRPPPREPRGELHGQPERARDSPSRHAKPGSGNGSRHNNNTGTPTSDSGTPKSSANQGNQEAHFYLSAESTVPRASEPHHITGSQTEGIQKRLNELEAFNQSLDIAEAKRRKLEAEYANIETDVVREGVRAEETSKALEALNA
ncbi:hypothetical protein CJU89_4957 [Yarrowia sp. B02]|nr:hypothetical protein CJU89_4957 [Yarrowia sp. B02]